MRKGSRGRRRCLVIAALLLMLLMLGTTASYAAGTESVLKQMSNYNIDSISNLVFNGLRLVGFAIVKGLATMTDEVYKAVVQIYGLLSFSWSSGIRGIYNSFAVLYKILFLVAFTFFGIKLMLTKNAERFNTINCIICIILVISAMPLFMEKMGKLTNNASQYAIEQWNDGTDNRDEVRSIASSVVSSNLVDLRKVDSKMSDSSLPSDLKKRKAYVSSKIKWKNIDINQYMDTGDSELNLKHSKVWENSLDYDSSGNATLKKIKGWTQVTSNYYYRWQVISWLALILELACIVVVLLFVAVRAGRIIIDLAMAMIYTPFVAVTDLSTGQRIKETIKDIIAHFAALFLIVALLSVYFVAITYIEAKSINAIAKVAMHIAVLWAVIDGPNIIERIAGIDVGYSGVWKTMLAGKAIGDAGAGAGRLAVGGAAAAGVAGRFAGKAGKAAGSVLVGKEGTEQIKNAAKDVAGGIKDKVSGEVQEATGGKGLLGFGRNAADAIGGKMTDTHSQEGLSRTADKAGAGIASSLGTSRTSGSPSGESFEDLNPRGDGQSDSADPSGGTSADILGEKDNSTLSPTGAMEQERGGSQASPIGEGNASSINPVALESSAVQADSRGTAGGMSSISPQNVQPHTANGGINTDSSTVRPAENGSRTSATGLNPKNSGNAAVKSGKSVNISPDSEIRDKGKKV